MNWDDLTEAWRKQPQDSVPSTQYEALKWRDTREFLAALLVAFVFGKAALRKGPDGWPLWIATILVLGVAAFFLKERIRAHRKKTGPDASLLEKIDADLGELRHQRQLLLKVGTWYLGPCVLSWLIVMASTGFHGLSGSLRTPMQMVAYFAGSLVLFWFIWKLNRRAVRKGIEPRIADLERLKNDLISEN
jgi:membrane protein implicated in regulation of membrane protease activity